MVLGVVWMDPYDLVRTVIGKRYVYVRNYMPHKIPGQYISYMFQTPTTRIWKSLYDEGRLNVAQSHFWKTKRPEELYDLENDPDEVHNLIDSPRHNKVILKMREAHLRHIEKIRDVGFLPEGEIHDRSAGSRHLTKWPMMIGNTDLRRFLQRPL